MIGTLSTILLALLWERYPRCVSDGDLRGGKLLGGIMLAKKSISGVSIIPCRPFPCHLFRIFVFPQSHKFGMAQVIGRRPSRVLESRH